MKNLLPGEADPNAAGVAQSQDKMLKVEKDNENRSLITKRLFPTANKPDPMPQNLAFLFTKITPEQMMYMWNVLTAIFVGQVLMVIAYCGALATLPDYWWTCTLLFGIPFSYIAIQNIYIDHDVMHGATFPVYDWQKFLTHPFADFFSLPWEEFVLEHNRHHASTVDLLIQGEFGWDPEEGTGTVGHRHRPCLRNREEFHYALQQWAGPFSTNWFKYMLTVPWIPIIHFFGLNDTGSLFALECKDFWNKWVPRRVYHNAFVLALWTFVWFLGTYPLGRPLSEGWRFMFTVSFFARIGYSAAWMFITNFTHSLPWNEFLAQDPGRTWPILHNVMALVLGGKHRWNEMLFHDVHHAFPNAVGTLSQRGRFHGWEKAPATIPAELACGQSGGTWPWPDAGGATGSDTWPNEQSGWEEWTDPSTAACGACGAWGKGDPSGGGAAWGKGDASGASGACGAWGKGDPSASGASGACSAWGQGEAWAGPDGWAGDGVATATAPAATNVPVGGGAAGKGEAWPAMVGSNSPNPWEGDWEWGQDWSEWPEGKGKGVKGAWPQADSAWGEWAAKGWKGWSPAAWKGSFGKGPWIRAAFCWAAAMRRFACAQLPDVAQEAGAPQSPEEFYDEILHSVGFNLFISGLIVANAVVIGMETDNKDDELWSILEFVFLGIFTVELILRLILWKSASEDFHVLTFGFAAAAVAIRNCSVLMLAAIYVSSITCVRVIIPFMKDSMLSLFFLLSEPDLMPYWDVLETDGLLAAFLIGFVVFVSFGMATIEDIMQILPDLDNLFVEEGVTFAREDLVNTVNCMDTDAGRQDDGSGSIDRKEFCHSVLHLAEGLRPISIMATWHPHLRQCLLQSMPRELRVDYAGNSFRWFDTDEMLRVHGADLSNFLAKSIEEHFKVPLHFQVLCDIEGPLTSGDFQRLLQNEAPKLTFCSETELTTASPFSLREKPRSSGPLPPLESDGCRVCGSDDKDERSARHTLRQQLAAAEEAHTTQELRVTEWQTRAKSADAALLEERAAPGGEGILRIHQSELRHQAEVLTLRHRVANCAEQEEWQQMELLLLKTQQKRSERAQEQELQELGFTRSPIGRSGLLKDLAARLAGCGLEILALENAIEAQRHNPRPEDLRTKPNAKTAAEALPVRKAEEESSRLASELQQEAEMLRREELAQQETLELQLQQLESQLEAALKAPAPELPKVEERKSDYISTADDELDKALEKEIFEKVYMQLTDSKVTVRVGVNYIPLAQWTKELFTNAEDPFNPSSRPFNETTTLTEGPPGSASVDLVRAVDVAKELKEQVAELQDMKQLLLRFQACLEGMEGGLSSQSFTMQGARVCGVLLEVVWLFGRVGVATNPKKSEVP
eukprot:g25877.t1